MPEPSDSLDSGIAMILGEIRGQMRELIHASNNVGQKLDALTVRVSVLEAEHNQRKGAANVFAMILKSPGLAWIISAAVSAWAILTGKVQL